MGRPTEIGNARRPKKLAVCNTCTIRLVKLAYQRAPWFRLLREPLRLGMRAMAAWHRIDPADYEVRTPSCSGCLRFYKVALKERSATFRWLNDRVNPIFDSLLLGMVKEEALKEAQAYARSAFFH